MWYFICMCLELLSYSIYPVVLRSLSPLFWGFKKALSVTRAAVSRLVPIGISLPLLPRWFTYMWPKVFENQASNSFSNARRNFQIPSFGSLQTFSLQNISHFIDSFLYILFMQILALFSDQCLNLYRKMIYLKLSCQGSVVPNSGRTNMHMDNIRYSICVSMTCSATLSETEEAPDII